MRLRNWALAQLTRQRWNRERTGFSSLVGAVNKFCFAWWGTWRLTYEADVVTGGSCLDQGEALGVGAWP